MLVMAACGDDGSDEDDGEGGSGGSTSTKSTGAISLDGGGGSGANGNPPLIDGDIVATSDDYVDTNGTTYRSSAFRADYNVISDLPSACAQKTFGACVLTQCLAGREIEIEYIDAGDVSLGGALAAPTLFADAFGEYQDFTSAEPLFAPGANLIATVAGSAQVAAHTLSVTAPSPPNINLAVTGGTLMVDSTQPLSVTWSGGTAERLALGLTTGDTTSLATVNCSFPTSDGQGEVPVGAMQSLMQGGLISIFSASVENSVTERIGDVEARFRVRTHALIQSTGAPFSGDLVVF
jgi:hypothetical protein